MRTPLLVVLASLSLVAPVAMACSSADSSSPSGESGDDGGDRDRDPDEEDSAADEDGGAGDAGRDSSHGDGSVNDAGADADAQEPDPACGDRATYDECSICCSEHHAAGYDKLDQTARKCACEGIGTLGGTAPCADECAAATCAAAPVEPTPGDDCDLCFRAAIRSGGACANKISAECQADSDCQAFLSCGQTYCLGK